MGAGIWIISFWLYAFVVWPSVSQGNLVHEFQNPVQSALQRVNGMNEQIVDNISDFHSYEYNIYRRNNYISDGGLDMYDNGNRVKSDTGADRGGVLVYFNGSLISCGVNVTFFVTQVHSTSDPSICEVYYAFGAGEASEGSFKVDKRSRDTNNLDTEISLERNPRNAWLGYMLLSRKGGVMIRESEVRESVEVLADAVLGCQGNLVHKFQSLLKSALQRVNVKKKKIFGKIYDFYQYSYDYNTNIQDGGDDMYNRGNQVYIGVDGKLRTLVSYELYYDRGDYEFSSSTGWPFTALMHINNTDRAHSVYSIQVKSNTGADGFGALVYFNGSLISCGVNVTYFVTQVYNATDPSICEVYYTFGAGEASEGFFKANKLSGGTGNLDTSISLEENPRNSWLGYTLLARKAGVMIRESEVRESVKVLAGSVLGCQGEYCLVKNITCINGGTCSNKDGKYYTCKCSPSYYEQKCRNYGLPTINSISSILPKTCTSYSSVEVFWAPDNQTNGIRHRFTIKSQNTLMPHSVTMMAMSGRVLFEDLLPFTTYELQVSVCPYKCIPKLSAKRKFITERELTDEVQNATLTSDGCSNACTVTWSWTEKPDSERITYTEVTWEQRVQKENCSITLQENGRAKVPWPVATYLLPTSTKSDNDYVISLQIASCACMGKTAVISGSCRPKGTCMNTWTVALATAAAISTTAAIIFGLLLILKTRKQTISVNTKSTAVRHATSGDSRERARNEVTGPSSPPQGSIYDECAGPSSPPEVNIYESPMTIQEIRGL